MEKLNKKVDYDDLKYIVEGSDEEFASEKFDDPVVFLNDIKTAKISLEKAKTLQQDYEEHLKKIRKGNVNKKNVLSKKELYTNINILFNARNDY